MPKAFEVSTYNLHFPTSNAVEEAYPFLFRPRGPGHGTMTMFLDMTDLKFHGICGSWHFRVFVSDRNSNLMKASNRAIGTGEELLVSLRYSDSLKLPSQVKDIRNLRIERCSIPKEILLVVVGSIVQN